MLKKYFINYFFNNIMILLFVKYIIFTFLLLISIYFYVIGSQHGCKLPDAINYNPDAVIEDNSKCKYNTLGCMDKNAANYNLYATQSCEEDCIGCENKGTCDLCKSQKKCTEVCPTCICKPKVLGCNRSWALNYDPKATLDNGSCVSADKILEKISVISGGDCKRCSGRASVKVGDKYLLLGGKQGINVIVLKRDMSLRVRHNRGFMTGNYDKENKKFVEFMRKYVFAKDIVIITVRGDAVGREKNFNENNEPVYVRSILTEDSKGILQLLGAQNPNIAARSGSYILIGSYLNDVYYESYSSNTDSYFPYFNLSNYGCFNFNNDNYEKIEIDVNKFKFLRATGDLGELEKRSGMETRENRVEFDSSKEFMLNRVDSVNRCALEVISMGYKVFSVSKGKCYIFKKKNSSDKNLDIDEFFASKKIKGYFDKSKKNDVISKGFRMGNGTCRLNANLQPYGNSNEESLFVINDIYYSGIHSMLFGGQVVQLFNDVNFREFRRDVGTGIHEAWSTIPTSISSPTDVNYIPINSIRIPNDFVVTLFRRIKENEDLDKNEYEFFLKTKEGYKDFKRFDLECCQGCLVKVFDIDTNKRLDTFSYRTWENIAKNFSFSRNETYAELINTDFSIIEDRKTPDIDNRWFTVDKFNLESFDEIERLKNYPNRGNVGYVQIYNFEKKKLRRIDFDTWSNFYEYRFKKLMNEWDRFHIKNIINPIPRISRILFRVVDPNKQILRKTATLYGYESTSKEVSEFGLSHRNCTNILKYGNCENNDNNKNPFTNEIKYLIVSKKNFGLTFYQDPNLEGLNLNLGFGRYNIPNDLCTIIRSLDIQMKNVIIKFYLEFNFKKEFLRIKCNDTFASEGDYKIFDLNNYIKDNKKIKSIIIEKLPSYTVISNNRYPENYDENKEYDSYNYTYNYSLSNNTINYLDFPYDYFKDEIFLDDDDKNIRVVTEEYLFGFLNNLDQKLKFTINSGGSIYNFSNEQIDLIEKSICILRVYDKNDIFKREMILYYGKWLRIEDDIFIKEPMNKISFKKEESFVKVFFLTDIEFDILTRDTNIFKYVNDNLVSYGSYLAIKEEDKFIRINYKNPNWKMLINFRIKVILKDDENEITLTENLGNTDSEIEFVLYIIKRKNIPNICSCNFNTEEYDILNLVYHRLSSFKFSNKASLTTKLPDSFNKLSEFIYRDGNQFVNFIENNQYELLNNLFTSQRQFIIQILNEEGNINKIYYFHGQKYSINENVNSINKIQFTGKNNDLYVSKHEKKAIISFKNKVDVNNNPNKVIEKTFNYRQDVRSVLNENLSKQILILDDLIKEKGIMETYDLNNNLIRKLTFSSNHFESIGKIESVTKIKFENQEEIIKFMDINRKLICILPGIVNVETYNKKLEYYLNSKSVIKLYNINNKLTKVILCKNNKFLYKYNGILIPLESNQYLPLLNSADTSQFVYNHTLDLDDNNISIQILRNNKLSEILNLKVNSKNLVNNYDNLVDRNISNEIKNNIETTIRLYNKDNLITKVLKIIPDLRRNLGFGNRVQSNSPILLYDNRVNYMEIYTDNIKYKLYQKNKLYYSIEIPFGMNGIYSYKIDDKIKYVNKVVRTSNSEYVKVYDENELLLSESDDETLHGYIMNIKFENYIGEYIIEYYPKTDCRILRLTNNYENVDTIIEENIDDNVTTELESVISKISKKNKYEINLDRTSMRITYPDESLSIILPEIAGEYK